MYPKWINKTRNNLAFHTEHVDNNLVFHTLPVENAMFRDIDIILNDWKKSAIRRPLIVRGARQIGKSYSIQQFGKNSFEHFVEINFEYQPALKQAFTTFDPQEIITTLSLITGSSIIPGTTLLFLDEIQECPEAIMALRYFFEKMPDLHVIAAGSLLEFTLTDDTFRMPVGRVQYLQMYPLSFGEFLEARGKKTLRDAIRTLSLSQPLPEILHATLLKECRTYAICGGMPAVVKAFLSESDSLAYQQVQTLLLQTYRDDFGKYATLAKHKHLEKVLSVLPRIIAEQVKYVNIDRETPSRELKEALTLLEKASVIHRINKTAGQGVPLAAQVNEKIFKLIFLDCGLAQRALGLDATLKQAETLITVNRGQIAEQFIGQELLAYSSPYEQKRLYFWTREKKSSSAEIDYVHACEGAVYPVEVKSGSTGRLKSMRLFQQQNTLPLGIRFSELPLSLHDGILSIPLYAVEAMESLLQESLKKSN